MRTFLSIILILFLFTFSNNSWSQENSKNLKTSYAFTIENISDVDQLGKIKSEIENLNFVEKVKINTKGEQPTKAQIIVYINEPKRTSEGQIMFEPSSLKSIILKDDINLLDLQIDSY
jgi:hypothetical protein